jgi:signal transduction histidine kinase/CheY-like chemotaxis protein
MSRHAEFTGRTLAMNPEGSRGGFDNRLPPWALELELEHAGTRLASEISARGRAEGALAEACRRRDEHVAMLAHELRNPLNAIQGALALLGNSDAAGQTLEASRGMIARQVKSMSRLIDDLLDVSRIKLGKMRIVKEVVSLAEAVENAIETCRPLIQSHRHTLEVNLPEQPILLEADPGRLEQVLSNLLNNAAKFTEPGGRLRVSGSLDGGQAVLRVQDTGTGMTGQMLSRVFDLFAQADRLPGRAPGGLGIGLTLVRSIIEMHGGTVTAESDGPGAGSEFTVKLPASRDIAAVPPRSEVTNPPARLQILVVGDNPHAADNLALLLRLAGYDVRSAHRGDEALAAAKALLPDAVLVDIDMPGIDGYQVATRMRAVTSLARSCLIAFSGQDREEDRIRSRRAGFDYHLTKPIDLKMVNEFLPTFFCRPRLGCGTPVKVVEPGGSPWMTGRSLSLGQHFPGISMPGP